MSQKEIIAIEAENMDKIYLFREGIFWKAYERSAYLLCRAFGKFKVNKKFVKNVGCDVVSIGFPCAVLSRYLPATTITEQHEKRVTARANETVDIAGFERWKEEIALTAASPAASVPARENLPTDRSGDRECLEQLVGILRNFNVESHTPMECMMCLSELRGLAFRAMP